MLFSLLLQALQVNLTSHLVRQLFRHLALGGIRSEGKKYPIMLLTLLCKRDNSIREKISKETRIKTNDILQLAQARELNSRCKRKRKY